MKLILAVLSLAVVCRAAPQVPFAPRPVVPGAFVPIVSQNFDLNGVDGSYTFSYESADGSARQESGVVNAPGTPLEAQAVQGSYTYVGTDGVPVQVNYVADENGFQPVGNVVAPAISRAVAAQVAQARAEGPILPGVPTPIPFRGRPF
ncbi:endocuticle structural glycoprotein SgAbd-9 [Schistocerca gregaria]|uniref:endocuticle structural glycoprotein SgAbd-9 n=1 Tax=Schistocerca gregaria TaxID=7010 RepID=UPI00211EA736|nr:endocuticle structural glycoprotein SgAbd-9 [Schistocerca gregaria]